MMLYKGNSELIFNLEIRCCEHIKTMFLMLLPISGKVVEAYYSEPFQHLRSSILGK